LKSQKRPPANIYLINSSFQIESRSSRLARHHNYHPGCILVSIYDRFPGTVSGRLELIAAERQRRSLHLQLAALFSCPLLEFLSANQVKAALSLSLSWMFSA